MYVHAELIWGPEHNIVNAWHNILAFSKIGLILALVKLSTCSYHFGRQLICLCGLSKIAQIQT